MVKRSIKFMFLAIALMIQPVAQAQSLTTPDRGEGKRTIPMRISSYEDDPFVALPFIQRMDPSRFDHERDGRPILLNDRVEIENESRFIGKTPTPACSCRSPGTRGRSRERPTGL